ADADDRAQRLEFLMACVDLASDIGADSVSFWSGSNHDGLPESEAWAHLVTGLHQLVEYANQRCVKLAFEPEPGMLVQYMDEFLQLADRLSSMGNHECFGLTLDVGHVHCLSDGKNDDHIRTHQDRLFNIHIEDMIPGTHEHLMFGEGNLDFDRVFTALHEIKYQGPVHVELSRHSHDAVETARAAFEFLQSLTKP
ncbi:MAG: sugar phosphate isomerase/epimerase family protein, partial [Phycisphaerae bacterium]